MENIKFAFHFCQYHSFFFADCHICMVTLHVASGCQAKFLDTFRNTLYNPLVDWGWLPWRREIL